MKTQRMPSETAVSLKTRTNKHTAKLINRNRLIVRHEMQRENSWKPQQNTDFIDTVVRGWHCAPISVIPTTPIEAEDGEEDETIDYVFDGAHKLEAVFNFIDNKEGTELKKVDEEFGPLKGCGGKKFNELPKEIQQKILNYEFHINLIDSETANDKESLKILWERLNRAGQKLNNYELALPVIVDLVKLVLKPSIHLFLNSQIYPKNTTARGAVEKILQMILATSDCAISTPYMNDFSSKLGLVKEWQNVRLGSKIVETKLNTRKHAEEWNNNLKLASQYMKYLHEANCFVDEEGNNILQPAHRATELPFLLGRAVFHFKKPEEFRRICRELAKQVKEKFFQEVLRDEPGRNGQFQKRILNEIDELLVEFVKLKQPRLFSKEQIATKLAEQKSKCALCSEKILSHQPYEGDHIVRWADGGPTTLENCRVVHERCNKTKN
jgi:hypothetical protein